MLYIASTLGLAGFVVLLFALERVAGVPPRIRAWMSPQASPAFVVAGCVIGLPVALVLLLPVLGNEVAQTIVWGGVYSSVIVVVGFLTARWWQPLYLASVVGLLLLVGGLFAGNTDDTVSDVVAFAFQTALLAGVLTALGVLLRLILVWLAGRDTRSTATTDGRTGGAQLRQLETQ